MCYISIVLGSSTLLIPKHIVSYKTYVCDTWIQFALFVLKGKSNTALALRNDNITLFESLSPNRYCGSGSTCFPSKRKLPVMYGLNNYLKTKRLSSLPCLSVESNSAGLCIFIKLPSDC